MKIINNNGELYCKITDLLEEIGHLCSTAVEKPQEAPQKGPFDQRESGDTYYYIDIYGSVNWDDEDDSNLFAIANYCADKELMEQRALHETLNRLLWRYSEQHGGDRAWWPLEVWHYQIYRDTLNDKWKVTSSAVSKDLGVVYFRDEITAEAAIKEIVEPFMAEHPEFVW